MKLSVGREAVKYFKWNMVSAVFSNAAGFIGMIVLARFIPPKDYGVAALAMGCLLFFSLFGEFGFSQALVGVPEVDKELVDAIITASLMIASVFYGAILFLSPIFARFYKTDILRILLPVAGLNVFLVFVSAVPIALLQRKLDFKGQAVTSSVSAFVSLAIGLGMAIAGMGVWSLVVPTLCGSLVGGIVGMYLSGYVPSLNFNFYRLRSVVNFGFSALVCNFSNYLCANLPILAMGKVWSSTVLGYYSFASSKYSILFDLVSQQMTGSLFPVMSRLTHDLSRVRNAFLRMTRLGYSVLAPLYALVIFSAPVFFPILLGKRWNEAIVPFQIMCLLPMMRGFMMCVNPVLFALGLPHISARIVIYRALVFGVVIIFCFLSKASLLYVAIGITTVSILFVFIYAIVCMKALNCSIGEFAVAMRRPLISVGGLCVVLLGLQHVLSQTSFNGLVPMVSLCLLASGAYFFVNRDYFISEWRALRHYS